MHGSKLKQCKCSPQQIEKYLAKISGPLLDRIAIHVNVQPVDVEMWSSSSRRMTSVEMRDMVQRAREIQARRFAGMNGTDCNARLPEAMFSKHCRMESAAEAIFLRAQKQLLVSARARGTSSASHGPSRIWMEANAWINVMWPRRCSIGVESRRDLT